MKRNEIIELNGVEYTLELNRESFIQIDKICNVKKSMQILQSDLYEYIEEIDDNYNPFEDMVSEEEINTKIQEQNKIVNNLVERSFFIWLYPNHKLPISKVKEILKPYLEDEEKASWIGNKVGELLNECVEMRQTKNSDLKNLKAQTNK